MFSAICRPRSCVTFYFVFTLRKIIRSTAMANYFSNDNIYISFPDEPAYYKQVSAGVNESKTSFRQSQFAVGNVPCFLVFYSKVVDDEGIQNTYVESAISSHSIYREATSWNGANVAHCVQFPKKFLKKGGCLKRGVCIYGSLNDNNSEDSIQSSLLDYVKNQPDLKAYELVSSANNTRKLITLRNDEDREVVAYFSHAARADAMDANIPRNVESPIFSIQDISPVFHSYQDARHVLEQLSHMPEVKSLLEITDKHVSEEKLQELASQRLPFPFVVVEGMDATGKTTLTEVLEKKMGATRFYTPPPQITELRSFFDGFPEIVRRAYYCMGNYIVAADIYAECQENPVIMDRFWHSTTAYGIANETSTGDLPECEHPVYRWPEDLLRPTLVLFLTVTEEIRKQRMSGRGIQATFEEKSLDKDQLFRQRLCNAYRRMRDPSCLEIDACGSVEEVQEAALKSLADHDVISLTGN